MGDPLVYRIGRLNRRWGWWGSKIHVLVYRVFRGRFVGALGGRPIVLLTTTGRSSGLERTTPITVMRDGPGYLAVASYGPQWQRNLESDPVAVIQDRGRTVRVLASVSQANADREGFRHFYPALKEIELVAAAEGRTVPLFRFTPIGS